MITKTAQIYLFQLISQTGNFFLSLDPETQTRLSKYSGKTIQINLQHSPFPINIKFKEDGISFHNNHEDNMDATITGATSALLGTMIHLKNGNFRIPEAVSIKGDMELVQGVSILLQNLEIDWEEYLSHYVGDVIAHNLGNHVRSSFNFLTRGFSTFKTNLREYLQEEARLTPCHEEVEDFYHDLTELQFALDRTEQRLHRIQNQKVEVAT